MGSAGGHHEDGRPGALATRRARAREMKRQIRTARRRLATAIQNSTRWMKAANNNNRGGPAPEFQSSFYKSVQETYVARLLPAETVQNGGRGA